MYSTPTRCGNRKRFTHSAVIWWCLGVYSAAIAILLGRFLGSFVAVTRQLLGGAATSLPHQARDGETRNRMPPSSVSPLPRLPCPPSGSSKKFTAAKTETSTGTRRRSTMITAWVTHRRYCSSSTPFAPSPLRAVSGLVVRC